MDSSKLSVKFLLANSAAPEPERIAAAFHGWIQTHAFPDHLLIDVADYKHVAGGPGTLLVAHQGNFALERDPPGLIYQRKQALDAPFTNRLRLTFRYALFACALLEQQLQLRFATATPRLQIHDRLLAPNTPATFAAVQAEAQPFLTRLYGAPVRLESIGAAEELLTVRITAAGAAAVPTLLQRLAH